MTRGVFLLSHYKGWNLEGLARDSALAISASPRLIFLPSGKSELLTYLNAQLNRSLIRFEGVLFINQKSFFKYVEMFGLPRKSEIKVWISHTEPATFFTQDEFEMLSTCNLIIVQNSQIAKYISFNLPNSRISIFPGAVNREFFFPSREENYRKNQVLISGDCKPRKNPDVIWEIVRNFPQIDFLIHGKGWQEYFSYKMSSLSNLTYISFRYLKQGQLLRESTAHLTVSDNEGGPLSILESLACGTPVISRSIGIWPDIMEDNNGWVMDEDDLILSFKKGFDHCVDLKQRFWDRDLLAGKYSFEELGVLFYS